MRHQFMTLFHLLGEVRKACNPENICLLDNLPVAVCDNYRIRRCKLYRSAEYRGYQASKHRYFYGLKIHLVVTKEGLPFKFLLSPSVMNDANLLDQFDFDLPHNEQIIGDKAYNA